MKPAVLELCKLDDAQFQGGALPGVAPPIQYYLFFISTEYKCMDGS